MLGRRRADGERWRKVRGTDKYALNIVRLRSKITLERGWIELLDPFTNTFWYLNRKTSHSTWIPPVEVFEKDLFCMWDPWPHPYESLSETNQPCRRVFKTMDEFQNHRKHCHNWTCPACEAKNASFLFPQCGVCANRLDRVTGEDLTQTLSRRFKNVFAEFKKPPEELTKEIRGLEDEDPGSDMDESDLNDLVFTMKGDMEVAAVTASLTGGVSSAGASVAYKVVEDVASAPEEPNLRGGLSGGGGAAGVGAAMSEAGAALDPMASAPSRGAPDLLSTGQGMVTAPTKLKAAPAVGLGAVTSGAAAALEGCEDEAQQNSEAAEEQDSKPTRAVRTWTASTTCTDPRRPFLRHRSR